MHEVGIRWSLHLWRIRRVIHVILLRKRHITSKLFLISLYLLSIVIKLDIHLPSWVLLLQFPDDLIPKGLISLHGDKGITKEVKSSSGAISSNNPKYPMMLLDFFEFCKWLQYFFELMFLEVERELSDIYFNKLNRSAKQLVRGYERKEIRGSPGWVLYKGNKSVIV